MPKIQITMLLLMSAVFCIGLPSNTFAHGGGLDANGCHTNHKTGEYHCHRSNATPPITPSKPQTTPTVDFQCGTKRTCSQMTSCAEARFYLASCGLTRLDGDGDGVPCESICK